MQDSIIIVIATIRNRLNGIQESSIQPIQDYYYSNSRYYQIYEIVNRLSNEADPTELKEQTDTK